MNTQLIFLSNIRILGLNFDNRLSLRPYLKKIITKCLTIMKTIKILGYHIWGSDTMTRIIICKAHVLSLIDYGFVIHNSDKSNILSALYPIYIQDIWLITWTIRTNPIESILYNAEVLPLQLKRQNYILKYTTKIKYVLDHIINIIFHNTLLASQICNCRTIFENHIAQNQCMYIYIYI